MAQLTKTMIGLLLISFMATGFILFTSYGLVLYNPPGYNDTALTELRDSFEETNQVINETYSSVKSSESNSGIVDIVGDFLSQSIGGIKIALNSVNVWEAMLNASINAMGLGSYAAAIKAITISIIAVLLIGILLHVLTKSDRV